MSLKLYAAVLALTTAAVVVVGAGAVHIWFAYEREASRLEQRPLVSVSNDAPRVVGADKTDEVDSPEGGAHGADFRALASRAAALCGVPEAVLFGLIARESSWRQYDAHGRTLRSSAGALGLTQIKPGSAREISATLNPHQPWGNLVAGSCYLAKYRRGGSWRTALMRYRLGPNYRRTTHAARAYVDTIMEGVE